MGKEEATLRGVEEYNNQTSKELSKPKNSTVDVKTDPEKGVESHTSVEDRAKTKLKELKNLEIFKLKEKTLKLTQKIETERGRRRELKKTESKENVSLRSKSISTLKNAGQKIKSLTNEKLKVVMKSKSGEDHAEEEKKYRSIKI